MKKAGYFTAFPLFGLVFVLGYSANSMALECVDSTSPSMSSVLQESNNYLGNIDGKIERDLKRELYNELRSMPLDSEGQRGHRYDMAESNAKTRLEKMYLAILKAHLVFSQTLRSSPELLKVRRCFIESFRTDRFEGCKELLSNHDQCLSETITAAVEQIAMRVKSGTVPIRKVPFHNDIPRIIEFGNTFYLDSVFGECHDETSISREFEVLSRDALMIMCQFYKDENEVGNLDLNFCESSVIERQLIARKKAAKSIAKFEDATGILKIHNSERGQFLVEDPSTWGPMQPGLAAQYIADPKLKKSEDLKKLEQETVNAGHEPFIKVSVNGDTQNNCWAISLFLSQVGNLTRNQGELALFIEKIKSHLPKKRSSKKKETESLISILEYIDSNNLSLSEVIYMFNHEEVHKSITLGLRQVIASFAKSDPNPDLDEFAKLFYEVRGQPGTLGNSQVFEYFCTKLGCSQPTEEEGVIKIFGKPEGRDRRNLIIPSGFGEHYNLWLPRNWLELPPMQAR